jgi:AraC-like DNA-binding protein
MKASAPSPYIFNNISTLMQYMDLPKPIHPLVALIPSGNLRVAAADVGRTVILDFYKVSFKTDFRGQVRYGQGYYDFEEGGLAFIGPHQRMMAIRDPQEYEGYTFFFHPDFIRNYPLGKTISRYGFFSYSVSEALFLSDKEKTIIAGLFNAMLQELNNNIDQFSQDVMISQIELLLNYSNRFYNRQFLTRKAIHHDLVDKMNAYLSERVNTDTSLQVGLPTVQEVADHLEVSARYLTDMLKSLTGQGAQQHIHDKLIEKAKEILSTSQLSIAEIAYQLGFEHPQSFNRLFRRKASVSPVEYRQSFH